MVPFITTRNRAPYQDVNRSLLKITLVRKTTDRVVAASEAVPLSSFAFVLNEALVFKQCDDIFITVSNQTGVLSGNVVCKASRDYTHELLEISGFLRSQQPRFSGSCARRRDDERHTMRQQVDSVVSQNFVFEHRHQMDILACGRDSYCRPAQKCLC